MLAELFRWGKKREDGKYPKENAKPGEYQSRDGRTKYFFSGLTVRRAVPKPKGKSAVRLAKKARRLAREREAVLAVSL